MTKARGLRGVVRVAGVVLMVISLRVLQTLKELLMYNDKNNNYNKNDDDNNNNNE